MSFQIQKIPMLIEKVFFKVLCTNKDYAIIFFYFFGFIFAIPFHMNEKTWFAEKKEISYRKMAMENDSLVKFSFLSPSHSNMLV